MLQIAILIVTFIVLSVYIHVSDAEKDREQKKCDETDWNNYYAHI